MKRSSAYLLWTRGHIHPVELCFCIPLLFFLFQFGFIYFHRYTGEIKATLAGRLSARLLQAATETGR